MQIHLEPPVEYLIEGIKKLSYTVGAAQILYGLFRVTKSDMAIPYCLESCS